MKTKDLKESGGNIFKAQSNSSILNKIIFCGKNTKDIKVQDLTFTVKTLSEKENRKIVDILLKSPEEERMTFVRAATLALAVDKINETPFDEIIQDKLGEGTDLNKEELFKEKAEVILTLQNNVVSKIFEGYESLLSETRESLNADSELKNS